MIRCARPVALAVVALALGVATCHLALGNNPEKALWAEYCSWGFCLIVCLTAAFTLMIHKRAGFDIFTILFFFAFGVGRYAHESEHTNVHWPEDESTLHGVVVSVPQLKERRCTFKVQTKEGRRVVVNLWERGVVPPIGCELTVKARVHAPRNYGNPDEFDYAGWLKIQGVTGVANVEAGRLVYGEASAEAWNSLSLLTRFSIRALQLRDRLVERYISAGLEDEALAVVSALTLGDKSMLSLSIRDLYSDAGAAHLLALSGLHLGIITGLFSWMLGGRVRRSRWRWLVCGLMLSMIWGFAFVAGLPTSLVRAATMSSFFLACIVLQRDESSFQTLLLAALAMLIVKPMYLLDVGTQLSFAAVAGILLFYGPMYDYLFHKNRALFFWLGDRWMLWPLKTVLVSLAAQVLTLPLVAYYFHRFSLYAPLFNVVLIPLTTALVYGALCLLMVAGVWPWLAAKIAVGLTWLVALQTNTMQAELRLPGAVVSDFWSRRAEPQLVVYHNRRCPALHIILSPEESYLLTPRPDDVDKGLAFIAQNFWERRLTAEPQTVRRSALVAGGIKAVMIDGDFVAEEKPSHVPQIDILWLCDGFNGKVCDLAACYNPRLLVLDASLSRWNRERLSAEAQFIGWNVYDVVEQGALIMPLTSEK